jgi:hypothetical protein
LAGLFEDFNPLQKIAANQHGMGASNAITRGSLISFTYPKSYAMVPNIIHDPYPMVILTDIFPKYIRGVNLHYLTFPYVKKIIESFGGNQQFSYYHIKPDAYIANAFRMYVRAGVQRPKRLDSEWIKTLLESVRSFNPGEVEKIKSQIQRQIQARLQAKAKELTSYEQWRKELTESQKRQFRGKVFDVNNAITQGYQNNLIQPNFGPEVPDFSNNTQIQQPNSQID